MYDIGSDATKHTPMSIHDQKQNLEKNIGTKNLLNTCKLNMKGTKTHYWIWKDMLDMHPKLLLAMQKYFINKQANQKHSNTSNLLWKHKKKKRLVTNMTP
jgi:hypothetical protein